MATPITCEEAKETFQESLRCSSDVAANTCASGQAIQAGACVECPKGKYSSEDKEECRTCEAGRYNSKDAQSICDECPYDKTSDAESVSCDLCQFGFFNRNVKNQTSTEVSCERCDDKKMKCNATGMTVQSLIIRSGWWRSSKESYNLVKCYVPAACNNGECTKGYTGPGKFQQHRPALQSATMIHQFILFF